MVPSKKLHGVAAHDSHVNSFINTWRICGEILIYDKSHLERSICHEFKLYIFIGRRIYKRILFAFVGFVLKEGISAAKIAESISTNSRGIRLAIFWNDTLICQVTYGTAQKTSITASVADIALDHVFRWKRNTGKPIWSNANAVFEHSSWWESPARAASLLIFYTMDATWPLIASIETCWYPKLCCAFMISINSLRRLTSFTADPS